MIWLGLGDLILLTLFSTLEMALRGCTPARLAERFEKTGRLAALETFAEGRAHYVVATSLLRAATVLALPIIAFGFLSAPSTQTMSPIIYACIWALILTIVFGVAIPNAWAKYSGDGLIVGAHSILRLVRWVVFPIAWPLGILDPLVRRLVGVPPRDDKAKADELEQGILDAVSEGERFGAVDEAEKEMIESVIELSDTRVNEIMTPRTEVVAIPKDADLDFVLNTIRSKGHSRIPVYDGTIDTIQGVLYAKDLLRRDADASFAIDGVMRKVLFIPETKYVRDLLREFQDQKVHIAVVLDEYGGTAGLVTIEDILEELVGEITDEYDPKVPAEMRRIDDRVVEVDGRMRVDELNDKLNLTLPEDEDYETIGGFVFSRLGKIPSVGDRLSVDNVAIRIIGAEPRRVTRLRLDITPVHAVERDAT